MNVVEVCKQILAYCIKQGYTYQISKQELAKAIMLIRGADKRTIDKWLNVLTTLNYCRQVSANVYELNLKETPDLLNEAITQGQKRLL